MPKLRQMPSRMTTGIARVGSPSQLGPAKPIALSTSLTVPFLLNAYCQMRATATMLVTTGAKKSARNTPRRRRMPEFSARARAKPMAIVNGTPTTTKMRVLPISRTKRSSENSRT